LKEDAQVDNLIKEIINDNLDVGCNCIVKQVQEKNFPDFELKWNTDIFKDISKEIQVREDTLPDNLKPHQVRNLKNKNYIEFQKRDFELKKKLNSEMLSQQDEFNM
jgi:CRISPR/Cas system CSM-associated protein Csm5 (group 7 of RAMP superfamily)